MRWRLSEKHHPGDRDGDRHSNGDRREEEIGEGGRQETDCQSKESEILCEIRGHGEGCCAPLFSRSILQIPHTVGSRVEIYWPDDATFYPDAAPNSESIKIMMNLGCSACLTKGGDTRETAARGRRSLW